MDHNNHHHHQSDNNLFPIEEVFESAVSIVKNLPKEGPIKPSDELKLKLYALYKQATHGLNDTKKPRFYQIVELYKWDAWRKLGNMSKEDAMHCYIGELKQIMDTIPRDETTIEDNRHFEDILGKKFYDYWFDEWNKQSGNKQINIVSMNDVQNNQNQNLNLNYKHDHDHDHSNKGLDDMVELSQSQAPDDGGYWTPTRSTSEPSFTSEMSNQFIDAILRLQQHLRNSE